MHGLVFTTWMILLMVQTGLVAGGQVRWHRQLGIAGAVLAAAVVVFGTAVQLASMQRDLGALESVPFVRIVVFGGFTSVIAFAGLAGAAIGWRRRPEIHKRVILIATIALLGAATARIGRIIGIAVPALGPLPFARLGVDRSISRGAARARLAHGQTAARRHDLRKPGHPGDAGAEQ